MLVVVISKATLATFVAILVCLFQGIVVERGLKRNEHTKPIVREIIVGRKRTATSFRRLKTPQVFS